MDLKKFLGGKIMKKVYEGRIIGFGFIALIIGALGFAVLGFDILYLSAPFGLLWLFNYDFNRYEAKFGHERGEEE